MTTRRALLAVLAASFALGALPAAAQEAHTDTLDITGGFTRATTAMAQAGAAFMTITSLGPADRLVAFRTPACNRPELHTHINDNGVMMMRQVEAIDIPAGGSAALAPGGLHLMMIDLNTQLIEGESVELTLVFENAGEVTLSVPVKGIAAMN